MTLRLMVNPLGRPRSAWEQRNHDQLRHREAVTTYLRAMGASIESKATPDRFLLNGLACGWTDLARRSVPAIAVFPPIATVKPNHPAAPPRPGEGSNNPSAPANFGVNPSHREASNLQPIGFPLPCSCPNYPSRLHHSFHTRRSPHSQSLAR